MDFSASRKSRLSPPQLQAQLSRLTERTQHSPLKVTLLSKGASLAAGFEDRRPVPHACVSQMALSPGRVRGKCPDAARQHHQRAEKTWQQDVDRLLSVPLVWFFLGPTTGTQRTCSTVPGRSAALDVCVASPDAAAAAWGDAAQAAFDRKLSNWRQEIPDLRNQHIHYRTLVWTADGRPTPARHPNTAVCSRHRIQP